MNVTLILFLTITGLILPVNNLGISPVNGNFVIYFIFAVVQTAERTYLCNECGNVINRDYQAH